MTLGLNWKPKNNHNKFNKENSHVKLLENKDKILTKYKAVVDADGMFVGFAYGQSKVCGDRIDKPLAESNLREHLKQLKKLKPYGKTLSELKGF